MGLLDKILGRKDQPKADFSDVRSGSSSTARPAAGTASGTASGTRTYTVVSGDSLSKIAKREYGDAQKWQVIYQANRDKISNPDLIHPGQVLNIPSIT